MLPTEERLAGLGLPLIPPTEEGGSLATAAGAMVAPDLEASTSGSAKVPESSPPDIGERATKKPKTGGSAIPTAPFLMSDCLPPVPAKLVAKILKGEYIDMAELLRDNIEAERRRATDTPSASSSSHHSNRREVPDFLSWLQCFGVYACVVASHKPEKFRQLMAYQTHMIREARRCGGTGWQGYDTMFRQLAAMVPTTDWGQLNSALYTVTFMAQQNGKGRTCQYCLETGHLGADCALAPKKPGAQAGSGGGLGLSTGLGAETRKPGSLGGGWSSGGPGYEARRGGFTRSGRAGRRGGGQGAPQPPSKRICYAWNEGWCEYREQCRYRHVCVKCEGDHPAVACKAVISRPSSKAE